MSAPGDHELGDSSASRTTPLLPMDPDDDRRPGHAGDAALTSTGKPEPAPRHAPTGRQPRVRQSRESSSSTSGASEGRFPPGAMLAGRYRVVHLLGRGGMGEVYCADDLDLGQRVALKFLPEKHERDAAYLARLRSEVRMARSVTHAHVCRVYDIGEADGRRFLSMELIDGEDLGALLRRAGRLPVDQAAEIGLQICQGLAAIHDRGILHRDLKPANILLDERGRARIADFGLASLVEQLVEKHAVQGTPAYMAPEQLGAQQLSIQSDLYALGLILYRLLAGTSTADLYRMRAQSEPPAPSTQVSGIPPVIDEMVMRCLALDPRARPASAREVAAALACATRGQAAALVVAVASTALDGQALAAQHGEAAATRVVQAHAQIFAELCRKHGGTRAAGHALVLFAHPGDAVHHALAYQRAVQALARSAGVALRIGVGIHLGVRPRQAPEESASASAPRIEADAATRALAERLRALAEPGQVLLTRSAFDLARQDAQSAPDRLQWLAHGSYELAGLAEPVEVCEVGAEGLAPLAPPADSELARRRRVQDAITGWRPAPGMELPESHQRPHWRMDRKLGEGGFGEVWLAEHEQTHERRVFKFCYDAEKLRALQRELTLFRLLKETLGDRRDIVRIVDWSFDHAPYFIESAYTAGGNLLEWTEAQGGLGAIPLATRLEILAQVATALAAAHSVGVLHKDVKPSNVLMAGGAEWPAYAQLGDFGVGAVIEKARLAEAGITALGLTADARTSMAAHGTRLYMAPELLEGKPATVQADIYALGVMLYQVVVGDFARALAPGWERDVDDELLRADIAAAVDGDPRRRPSSAAQLAEQLTTLPERRQELADMRRELAEHERQREAGRRAEEALRQARKRRKLAAVATATLLVFAGVVTAQSLRIAREARAAEAAARQAAVAGETAQQVSDFLVALFGEADPHAAQGREVSAREVLDRSQAKIAELDDQPEVQAALLHVMGKVYGNIGLYRESAALLERAVEKRRALHGDRHLAVAASLHELAMTLERQQALAPAERAAREALDLRRALLGEQHLDTLATMEVLADAVANLGRPADAEPLLQQVLDTRRRSLGAEHALVAQSLTRMGSLRLLMKDSGEAARWYGQALDMYQRLPGNHASEIATAKYYLGISYGYQNDVAAAEPLLREALAENRALLGEEHPWVGAAMSHLAFIYRRTGRYEQAEDMLRGLLDLYRKSSGEDSAAYAVVLGHLAFTVRVRGACAESDALSQQSLAALRTAHGGDHVDVALGLNDRGMLLESWGDAAAAESHYRDALDMFRRLRSEDDPYFFAVMANLAHVYATTGRPAQAEPLLAQATAALEQSRATDGWHLQHVNSVRGAWLAATGQHAAAEDALLRAYEWLETHHGKHRYFTQRALERIITFLAARGRTAETARYSPLLDHARCASLE